LYHHPPPDIPDYACKPNSQLLDKLCAEVDGYALDEYLPSATLAWCSDVLLKAKFSLPVNAETANEKDICMHKLAYCHLLTVIQQHINTDALPKLAFVAKSTSTLAWQPSATTNVSELELTHNGPDEEFEVSNDFVVYSNVEDLLSYL
jgi:hypothetical protein